MNLLQYYLYLLFYIEDGNIIMILKSYRVFHDEIQYQTNIFILKCKIEGEQPGETSLDSSNDNHNKKWQSVRCRRTPKQVIYSIPTKIIIYTYTVIIIYCLH